MQVGDVSDIPIRYLGNWYILRRGESVPKTFAEAKPEMLVSLRNSKYGEAFQLAQKAKKRLQETKDPQKVAQEWRREANMTPAEMVRETAFVKARRRRARDRVNQQFEQALRTVKQSERRRRRDRYQRRFCDSDAGEKKEPRIPDLMK